MSLSLTQSQQSVVAHDFGPLLVVAGPGAGKTRVLVERVRRLLEGPGHFRILALTFTNKAANEMKERIVDIPEVSQRSFIGTMHSFCMEVLENRGKAIGLPRSLHIFESFADRKEVLAQAIRDDPLLSSLLQKEGGPKEQARALSRWLAAISEFKSNLVVPEFVDEQEMRLIYEAYDGGLRASSAVDFDDLLLLAYRIFEEAPKIGGFYRRQFRYICVDEAQDINEAQYRLLCALCGKDHRNVMLVGDPKQAIYVWNGADPKYLDLFKKDFAAKEVTLEENFRSSRAVVQAAMVLNPSYSVDARTPLQGNLTLEARPDEAEEANFVCEQLKSLQVTGHPDVEGPIDGSRCAILGRNRYVFAALEEELSRRGIEYHKKLATGAYQSESSLIRQFELALRVVSNPHDRLHLGRLAKEWELKIDANAIRSTLATDPDDGLQLLAAVSGKSNDTHAAVIHGAVEAIFAGRAAPRVGRAFDLLKASAQEMEDAPRALVLEDVRAWRRHWDQFIRGRSSSGSLQQFLSQLALGTTEQARGEGVALLTVHSSKGMEFDVVFVIGLCEGVFPDYRATGEQLLEENRSAFVAVTRARRLLYLSYPKERMMPWGDTRKQIPSRYWRALLDAQST